MVLKILILPVVKAILLAAVLMLSKLVIPPGILKLTTSLKNLKWILCKELLEERKISR